MSLALRLAEAAMIGKSWRMDTLAVAIRPARPDDADAVARVYIDSWHDTYAGVLPTPLLCAMTPNGQSSRWGATIRARGCETVLVAEHERFGLVGMASMGPARDAALPFDSEVYTLYVDPNFYERGVGRALLSASFAALAARGFGSCVIWAHARNPARFFYEALGGRQVAARTVRMMGGAVPETAFGWPRLRLAERADH
ncbi:MAG: GNAT family N-acetyltransferase [Alphaproteobacteria bacterium]|nr:GNAT family N-acetyltransferase [Alphaproteobacteria bacterium]